MLIRNGICTPVFIAVLFTIAKIWKDLKCSLTDEWIKMLWYIYNGILSIKKNEILPFITTWMELERVMLSNRNKSVKDK